MKLTKLLIIFSFALALFGACNPSKRATKKIHKAVRIDKPTVDRYFADNYHLTDSTDVRVEYRQGETITDTIVYTELEFINDTVYKTEIKKVYITRTDTAKIKEYVKVQDGAKLDVLEGELTECKDDAAKSKERAKTWRLTAIIAILAIVLYWVIIFVIRKFRR